MDLPVVLHGLRPEVPEYAVHVQLDSVHQRRTLVVRQHRSRLAVQDSGRDLLLEEAVEICGDIPDFPEPCMELVLVHAVVKLGQELNAPGAGVTIAGEVRILADDEVRLMYELAPDRVLELELEARLLVVLLQLPEAPLDFTEASDLRPEGDREQRREA